MCCYYSKFLETLSRVETPFSWILEADEIENVPKRQKTDESHARAQILHNKVAKETVVIYSTRAVTYPFLA